MNKLSFSSEESRSFFIREQLIEYSSSKVELNIAISGGSTPNHLFNYLGNNPISNSKLKISVYWADERFVPFSDDRNNAKTAIELWLCREENCVINRVNTNLPIQDAVKAYASNLPSFDAVLLGVGLDGHIASIFPEQIHGEKVFSCQHPSDGTSRISLNYSSLIDSESVLISINGSEKWKLINDQGVLPIHQLLKQKEVSFLHVN